MIADLPMGHPRRRLHEVPELVEIVRELVSPGTHRQSYRAGWTRPNRTGPVIKDHVTHHASLLEQLRRAVGDRSDTGAGGRAGQVPVTSMPRFSADAFDRLEAIRRDVTQWCDRARVDRRSTSQADAMAAHLMQVETIVSNCRALDQRTANAIELLRQASVRLRTAVEPDLLALVVRAPSLDTDMIDELTRAADRWRTWCRIMAGWETAPLRPHVPCPGCGTLAGERAGLRVRIDSASGTGGIVDTAAVRAAVCLTCDRTWDAASVGLLGAQLRSDGQA
jgi:hypothetical protein